MNTATAPKKFLDYSKVPDELKQLPYWGLARLVEKGERRTKIPVNAITGANASSTALEDWTDFDTALAALQRSDQSIISLGFLLQPPYMLIDLDHLDTWSDGAQCEKDFIAVAGNGYYEKSQSGTGLHFIIKSNLPLTRKHKEHVEMYTEGRFVALTGNAVHTGDIQEVPTETLKPVYEKYFNINKPAKKATPVQIEESGNSQLSDDEVISRAGNSNIKFSPLFHGGDWQDLQYGSQSEADQALANFLAFWTNKDLTQMDRLFRQSGLMRDKWDEKHGEATYGQMTLEKAIADVANGYNPHPKKVPARRYSDDDRGASDRLSDQYGKLFLYDVEENQVLFYDGKVWKPDTNRQLTRYYNAMADTVKNEAPRVPPDATDEVIKKAQRAKAKFVTRLRQRAGKIGALDFFKDSVSTGSEVFDADNNLLNTPSGVLHLNECRQTPSNPDYRLTKITVGKPAKVQAPKWLHFLNTIFEGDTELIDFIQRAVGYSIAGTNYERVMFILYGDGANNGSNGKSTFVQTIANVLGDYSVTINPTALAEKKFGEDSDKPNPEIARTEGERFVTTSELPQNQKLNEAMIKRLTSGEAFPVRTLYKNTHDFLPTGVIWLTTNFKPTIQGQEPAIWKRLVFIPMTAVIAKPQLGLSEILTKEEADGIFQWILDGYKAYRSMGLKIPNSILANNASYKDEMDVVKQFADDCILTEEGRYLPTRQLLIAYNEWAKVNHVTMKPMVFASKFKVRYAKQRHDFNNSRGYEGLALTDQYGET